MSSEGYALLNEEVKNDVANAAKLVDFVKGVANAAQLQACLEAGTYADRIQSDTALSRTFGVQGTPSFFVNERNYPGAYSYVEMESTVAELLK
jgi:protein-disulfide isomerase